ncbi:MAG: asparagine synthase (glutamine-hydrolyzing) [Myxococcales bacterium]|nr:asparagine synthase (glutamine-hydrolyzing) [Myxococcales bacterium]
MCGILLTYGTDRPFHHRLLASLRKRGPDSVGFWTNGSLHMGHTRLAILGLDERGIEPLENDTHVLIYNGEIYNFIDLSSRLEVDGVHVSATNDAETLLHLWSRYGETILADLTGFWAFAIYDKAARKLTLVRDQLGIKPLYYARTAKGFHVASTIGALLDVMDESPELDYEAMSEYVRYQFTFADKTFVKQIKKVLPGHLVEIDLDTRELRTRCYEDIFQSEADIKEPASAEWVEKTRELFGQCCIDSTISDTSFTTFCSGGLDSSLITRVTTPEIAYHCNFSDAECNETFFAQQAVKDTRIRLFVVNAEEQFDLVEKLASIVEDFDELSIGSVILPLEDLLTHVKRRYKVILTGTGGDELFAGYVRYQLALGQCFHDPYRALYDKMQGLKTPAERFELAHRKGDPQYYRFYEPKVAGTFQEAYDACGSSNDELRRMLTFDRRYFLSGLLNIDDKMCGRHSLESRPSFLHQAFVRHIRRLDSQEFIQNHELKWLLRKVARGTLPDTVIERQDKMGFTTPIGTFVNRSSHRVREQLTSSRFRDLYDLRKMNLTAETKFSREVFGLVMLDLWLNRYVKGRGGDAH